MARGISICMTLVALVLAGWAGKQNIEAKVYREKHQALVDQLETKTQELEQAFAENRRLTMAQAGAVSELETAQARIRELETEVETTKEELANAPADNPHAKALNWHKKHHEKALQGLAETIKIDVLGGIEINGNQLDEDEFGQLKDFFELKKQPLEEEQAEALAKLFDEEPGNTQTITQEENGNGLSIVVAIAGDDGQRDERIREKAAEILTPKQHKLLKIWQKMRGTQKFQSMQTFQFKQD
jgi:hypothetical protein